MSHISRMQMDIHMYGWPYILDKNIQVKYTSAIEPDFSLQFMHIYGVVFMALHVVKKTEE